MKKSIFHVLLTLATAGMELCWLYSGIFLFSRATETDLSIIMILSAYPAAFALGAGFMKLRRIGLYGVLLSGWLVWTILQAKMYFFAGFSLLHPGWVDQWLDALTGWPTPPSPEQLLILCSGILWFFGSRLALMKIRFTAVISGFQFGVFMLLLLFLIAGLLDLNILTLSPITPAFFFFALFGVSLAHAMERDVWITDFRGLTWIGLLWISICLILGAGLLLATIVNPQFVNLLIGYIKALWRIAISLFLKIMQFLLSLLPELENGNMPVINQPSPEMSESFALSEFLKIPDAVKKAFSLLYALLWASLILAALWSISSQIFSWLFQRIGNTPGAEIRPISGAFREDLLRLFKWLISTFSRWGRRWFCKGKKANTLFPAGAAALRRIYQELLQWAASRGYPRHGAQTPHEYLSTLLEKLPEAREELRLITHEYVQVRYGELFPGDEVQKRVRESWDSVRRGVRRKRKTGGKNPCSNHA